MTRKLGLLVGAITLAATGTYVFVYLYRWEWNRALMSAALFIATEIAVVGWRLAERMGEMSRRIDDIAAGRPDEDLVRRRLQESAPDPKVTFEWLSKPGGPSVFIPVLLGAGVVISTIAWLLERLARRTARPLAEQHLAHQLGVLSLPPGGFLARPVDPVDVLRRPVVDVGGRRRGAGAPAGRRP